MPDRPQHNAHVHTWFRECVISLSDVERAAELSRHIPVVLANHGVVCSRSYEEARHWWLFLLGEVSGANFRGGVLVERVVA